jgi:hypothetical protein
VAIGLDKTPCVVGVEEDDVGWRCTHRKPLPE